VGNIVGDIMRLDHATWGEVEEYLTRRRAVLLPVGSTEQHGPMGLIGTDAICAEAIAVGAGGLSDTYVAPVLAYTPAPFNMKFAGTVSISEACFQTLFTEVTQSLRAHGFDRIYVVNGHGANLAPMRQIAQKMTEIRIRSWWDFDPVNILRTQYYGAWEGMHATPSEVAITQALVRCIDPAQAATPPRALSPDESAARAGDRHGSASRHKAEFPDGRVGSHSALARPEHGRSILQAAIEAVAADVTAFEAG
jgi:creatinine amidohydrolase